MGSWIQSKRPLSQFAVDAGFTIALPGHLCSISNNLLQDLQCLETDMYQAVLPNHPHLCIVLGCTASQLKSQQAAVINQIREFGRFQNVILN